VTAPVQLRLALGADHAGFRLKDAVARHLTSRGHLVSDHGTNTPDSVDYPDYAARVGAAITSGQADLGICVCGSGTGISIAANKLHGIRAANCTTELAARMAREHNDANVLCLGERFVGEGLALAIVDAFLEARFAGGRHQTRVTKISALDDAR